MLQSTIKKTGLIILFYKHFFLHSLFWWHRLSHFRLLPFSHHNTDFMTKFYWFHFHNNSRHSIFISMLLRLKIKSHDSLPPIQPTLKTAAKGFLLKFEVNMMALSHSLPTPPPNSLKALHTQNSWYDIWGPPASDLSASSCINPWLCPIFEYITCSSTTQWLLKWVPPA